ncbi:MAG: hypothetical protein WBD79_05885, partial [Anaerolineae bacterium]
ARISVNVSARSARRNTSATVWEIERLMNTPLVTAVQADHKQNITVHGWCQSKSRLFLIDSNPFPRYDTGALEFMYNKKPCNDIPPPPLNHPNWWGVHAISTHIS